MAKYFYDSEFIEGFYKPRFGKRRHFIDLISVALVCEDGREYYAISNEFNPKDASEWVKKNVIEKLEYREPWEHDKSKDKVYEGWEAVKKIGKSNKQIASDIIEFVNPGLGWPTSSYNNSELSGDSALSKHFDLHNVKEFPFEEGIADYFFAQPTFYGYYADYDHVLLCSLFGTMMDLPPGFPMYTRDIKQMVDAWVVKSLPTLSNIYCRDVSFEEGLQTLKDHPNYPKETNEHNALADARWNRELYNFITT